jgi:thymidylate synthase (FAD)
VTQITAKYIHHCGSDLTVANSARVSFAKESELEDDAWGPPKLKEKDAKLIRYLAREKHISPFGHCFATFRVKAPIFVARQLVKHKFLRWNEVSRRYVSDNVEFYEPDEWRGQAEDKKQGSDGWVDAVDTVLYGWQTPQSLSDRHNKSCLSVYKCMIDSGVCEEQARMVLPASLMTEWYWSGSLDAFADMCRLRCKSDTQEETQEVAWDISLKMEELFPVSWVALRDE